MTWNQNYNPLGNAILSPLMAALPVVALLGSIALLKIRVHLAALAGLGVALAVAVFGYHQPVRLAAAAAGLGAAYGLFPIGWIILNLIFLYQLTVDKGYFAILRGSFARVTPDPRVQVILIAFCLGAFFEGAAGFGTPVAVTAAILMQLGFRPLEASGLSLIANTAPVAFGGLGTPIIALSKATGIDEMALSAMIGRQLPIFSVIIPFWVVWAMAGFGAMREVWPAALTAGVAFAVPQFIVSNFFGPTLVDIVSSLCSITALVILLRFWQPARIWKFPRGPEDGHGSPFGVPGMESRLQAAARQNHENLELPPDGTLRPVALQSRLDSVSSISSTEIRRAWTPWILLTLFVFVWGLPAMKARLNGISSPKFALAALDHQVVRMPPVVTKPTPEEAVFTLNWLSATGTGILAAALVGGLWMGFSTAQLCGVYARTLARVRFSLITIAAMLALGYVTRYSGTDTTLGLALAGTGSLYPFFGTMLGWLGVALTGSDTASNVLFGGLQRITAGQTGVSAILMAAANSSGGVMGKMVDAQSIVVASTATNWYGHEGRILRYVFLHSLALAALVGILVFLQARVFPFSAMVVN